MKKNCGAWLFLTAFSLISLGFISSCIVSDENDVASYSEAAKIAYDEKMEITGFKAIEGNRSVMVVWNSAKDDNLTYRITCKNDSTGLASTYDVPNPKSVFYKSIYNLQNDTEYTIYINLIDVLGRTSEPQCTKITPKEKITVRKTALGSETEEITLKEVPETPNASVAIKVLKPEIWEKYSKGETTTDEIDEHWQTDLITNPGELTNGRMMVPGGSAAYLKYDGYVFDDNVGACDRLFIAPSGVVWNNLRDGEWIHIFKIKVSSKHYEAYAYIYNKKLEESLKNGTSIEEKTSGDVVWFDTVKDLENCATIYKNSTASTATYNSYDGVTIKTRGYYEIGDGGAATYKTQTRETYVNKRARQHFYKYLDHKTAAGQIVNYVLGNIECDVNGDGVKESVPGVNMRQLGAGKCTLVTDKSLNANYTNNDDAERFEDAVNMLYDLHDANSTEYVTLYFPAGEYRMGKSIGPVCPYFRVIGDTDILKTDLSAIDEDKIVRTKNSSGWETWARSKDALKRSVLYTDNGGSYSEFQFSIWDCSHFYMRGITMECRKTKRSSHSTERMVAIASDIKPEKEEDVIQDITVEGCEIYVDENCHKDDGNLDRQFTSVTVYSGVKDVKIKNNLLVNMSGVERGACYGVFDFWGNGNAETEVGGTEDILIEGNLMYHNCHDESGGVFTTGSPRELKPNCYVHRVTIRGNEMHPQSSNASSRTMCFTMAYAMSFNIRDVLFENNHVIADFPSKLMTFGHFDVVDDASNATSDFVDSDGKIYGVVVRNNTFDICQHWSNSYVFETSRYAWIHDNTINILKGATGGSVFQGPASFDNNTITDYSDGTCSTGGIAYMAGRLKGNTVTMHGKLGAIALSSFDIQNNTFTLGKPIGAMFNNPDASGNITISGNTVNYNIAAADDINEKDTGWQHTHVLALGRYGNKENNYPQYTVNFTGNTILAPYATVVNKHVLYSKFPDEDPNIINIKNNTLQKFTWVRSQMVSNIKGNTINWENNKDENGNVIPFSIEGKVNFINLGTNAGE